MTEKTSPFASAELSKWLRVGGVVGFVIGLGQAFVGNAPAAGVAFAGGALLFLLPELERFEVFELLGFKAKLRALGDKLHDAEQVAGQLRKLTLTWARNVVRLVTGQTGYSQQYSWIEEHRMLEEVRGGLLELGISLTEIENLMDPYNKLVADRLAKKLTVLTEAHNASARRFTASLPEGRKLQLITMPKSSWTNPDIWNHELTGVRHPADAPEELEGLIEEIRESIEDLEVWQKQRRLRRDWAYYAHDKASI